MNVRSTGLKFKIATNFIWRVGHGIHHRDSTLPPYGWSNHEVNSERLFFSSIRRVEHRGLIRREKNHLLFFLERARTDLSPVYSVKVRHLEQARSNLCHLGSACSSHLVRPTHLVNKRGAHEKARPTLCHVGSVKVFSMFLLTLQLTPPALFPACSVKTSHLEQARSDLCPAGSVKVDCVIV